MHIPLLSATPRGPGWELAPNENGTKWGLRPCQLPVEGPEAVRRWASCEGLGQRLSPGAPRAAGPGLEEGTPR